MRRILFKSATIAFAFVIGVSFHSVVMRISRDAEPNARPNDSPSHLKSGVKVEYCELHRTVLMYSAEPSDVFPEVKHDAEYFEAMKRWFPHSNSVKIIGCGNGPSIEQEESLTCPACRFAESQWNEKRSNEKHK